ncbi:unnamed protein product [Thlaspi arvense]|uniref:Uncharacterized protein n=1 Tax=Thlaspi arvense TaxID=13288 RepID=A0AAU9RX60_THLAR|nr:unnamed protein product [Thlaspi arvense]
MRRKNKNEEKEAEVFFPVDGECSGRISAVNPSKSDGLEVTTYLSKDAISRRILGNCSDSEIRECLHESHRDDIHVFATEENEFIFLKNFVTATDINLNEDPNFTSHFY